MIGTSTVSASENVEFTEQRREKIQDILDNGFLEFMYTMEHDWDMAVTYIESWEMNFTDEEMNQVREVYDRFKDHTETDWSAFANSQQND